MYGSYGAFKKLGLSTSSHREPTMSRTEWASAYGTGNNIQPPRHLSRRPVPPPSRLQRTESGQAAVTAMVAAARALRQSNAAQTSGGGQRQQRERVVREERKEVEGSGDDGEYSSDEDEYEDEPKPQGGIEREARADRRLQQLRKRHRTEQDNQRKRKEKTKRTRTLKRSASDVEVPTTSPPASPKSHSPPSSAPRTPSLPSLGGTAVADVRERTRLLLRDALIKTDSSASTPSTSTSSTQSSSSASSPHHEHTLLASDIEQALFEHHDSTPSTSYRQHSRSLIYSLCHNAELTPSLLSLSLSPLSLVALAVTELANASRMEERAKEKEESAKDLVLSGGEGVKSDEWMCDACGGWETETFILKEGRDLRKAEVWGGGGDDVHSVILVRCMRCRKEWKKEV